MAKTISIDLNAASITAAIKELDRFTRELERKNDIMRERIAKLIEGYAQNGFNNSIVDDRLAGGGRPAVVTVKTSTENDRTLVIADGKDAVWVEFGAGVYHNGAAGSSPHPNGSELGLTIGSYGPAGKRKVWGYYENPKEKEGLILTHGTPATMPQYKALRTVCEDVINIAKEVFA